MDPRRPTSFMHPTHCPGTTQDPSLHPDPPTRTPRMWPSPSHPSGSASSMHPDTAQATLSSTWPALCHPSSLRLPAAFPPTPLPPLPPPPHTLYVAFPVSTSQILSFSAFGCCATLMTSATTRRTAGGA